ncbi:MAG: ATP-binding cassette domain-containing protein, partial [Promethearchaeota archaeon]
IIESAMAASDRIYCLLQEKVEIPEPENPATFKTPVRGEIYFVNVWFGYRLEKENDVQVEAPTKRHAMPLKPTKKIMPVIKAKSIKPMAKLKQRTLKQPEKHASTMTMKMAPLMHAEKYSAIKPPMIKPSIKNPDGTINKQVLMSIVKMLEKRLNVARSVVSAGGSIGGESGASGSMQGNRMLGTRGDDIRSMLRMLASIEIPDVLLDEIPNVIKTAIKEEKTLMMYEKSAGYVFKNLTAKIPAGKTVAIVGETGVGKTTFIKLISRFYDVNEGQILVDGIDVRNVRKKDLRDLIGIVPQDSFLFGGSIKENLLYGIKEDDITPEIEDKMIKISKFLGLHNFIENLPDGYETILTENASNISIGQRQLIAFARALIADPRILILDEATSSVDPYTETLIQDALDKAREGRTTIIIAHRLSTIKNADWIFVLGKEKANIVEQGTHEDLIKLGGKYKRLLDMQHKDIEISNL